MLMIRRLLMILTVAAIGAAGASAAEPPAGNPVKRFAQAWTDALPWDRVVDVTTMPGETADARLAEAQKRLAARGGGVAFFPAGEYRFADDIVLADGVILRGADPIGVADARDEKYAPRTRLVFPKYKPTFTGDGTPVDTAFKGIVLADPAKASRVGVVNVAIDYGHIHFGEGDEGHQAGRDRLVAGCVLRSAARLDPSVPDKSIGQTGWERFTARHLAAIHVYAAENVLVAGNRLPDSSADNYLQKGYVIQGRGRDAGQQVKPEPGVWFDYDNRPGISVNNYTIGGIGGRDPKGTPETYPWGFRKGIVITGNYIYSTGRCAIGFTGDGTVCSHNVIRFKPGVHRWTHTGRQAASGSSTNGNRAVQMRGWRWTVEGNDYEVYRNFAGDSTIPINDGEGLMHEGHANAVVRDSKVLDNRGNAYLSIYKTAGIDGLLVRGNTFRVPGGISAIYVNADRNWDRHECRNVLIEKNVTAGSGILISGDPASNNVIRDNRHEGPGGVIVNQADAKLEGNVGYTVRE